MRIFSLIALLLFNSNVLRVNDSERNVIVVNSYDEAETELRRLLASNSSVDSLTIIVPSNRIDWTVYSEINLKRNTNPIVSNPIRKLPKVLFEYSSLTWLDISNLGIEKLDSAFSNLGNLNTLNVSHNPIQLRDYFELFDTLKDLSRVIALGLHITESEVSFFKRHGIELVHTPKEYQEIKHEFAWKDGFFESSKSQVVNVLKDRIDELYREKEGIGSFSNQSTSILEKDWTSFSNDLKVGLESEEVFINSSPAFPAFTLIVPLSDENKQDLRERKILHVSLSLLTNHYTIFVESTIFFQNYKRYGDTLYQRIFHGEKNSNLEELNVFNKVKDLLIKHFPNYKYVSHSLLMNNTVQDKKPLGTLSEKSEYPIYSFLFGLFDINDGMIVE